MALPKIQSPTFEVIIPSINKEVTFRPFLVKEEKILLMAQQSADEKEIIKAIKQVVNNCCLDDKLDIDKLATFDLEYLFLKLRARSVNNIVEILYKDFEDDKEYKIFVNLDDVEVVMPKKIDKNVKINKKSGILMKYPSVAIVDEIKQFDNEIELLNFFIIKCIDEIYDENDVYPASEQTEEELKDFIDNLDVKTFDKIREFMENMPKLEHKVTYKNSLGNEKNVTLSTLNDFFMLR
jgi:phosphotransferase system HPr-like phosphotransfer protein